MRERGDEGGIDGEEAGEACDAGEDADAGAVRVDGDAARDEHEDVG